MNFKKTVAGISAAAIAVTQVAAVIPMGAFAASEQPVSSNVQLALKYKASTSNGEVTADASAKNVVLSSDAVTAGNDETGLGFSYSGEISGAELADGDKYTFTADGLKIVANEKDKTTEDETTTVLEGPSILYNDRINVENAGDAGDVVTITYTKLDSDIKVVDANGAEISSDTSTDGTCTFTLTADSAGKFVILGSIEVSKVEVTKTKTTPLADIDFEQTEGSQTVNIPEGAIIGDKNTVAISIKQQYSDFDDGVPQCKINVSVNGESSTYLESSDISFDINSNTSEFIITGTNAKGSVELISSTTTDFNISGVLSEPRTVSADEFANAKVGDKITVYCSGDFSIKSGEKELTYTEEDDNAAVTIDSDNLNNIKTNGIALTGSGSTLIWVKFISVGETTEGKEVVLFDSDEPVVWSQTWTDGTDGGYWSDEQSIGTSEISDNIGTIAAFKENYENITATWDSLTATKFVLDEGELWAGEHNFSMANIFLSIHKADVKKGGKIIVEYKGAEIEDEPGFILCDSKKSPFGSTFASKITKTNGSVEFVLDEEVAQEISTNDFFIGVSGCRLNTNLTVTSVKYEAPAEKKIEINTKNFPDANFRKALALYDKDKDNKLSESEIAAITDLGSTKADEKFKDEALYLAKVTNFEGIENLTALKSITLTNTQKNFTALDLSQNTALTFVNVSGCTNLADLKLPETAAIETLLLRKTAITAVDVSKYTALKVLNVSDTKLTALVVKANTALETLALANTAVAELDVKANTALTELDAANCKLTEIDVSANTALEKLDVSGNRLIALDLTGLTALTSVDLNTDGNVRNIGEVVDGEYDLADLIKEGLDVSKMTIKTEGVTIGVTSSLGKCLKGITGNVEYDYDTGSTKEGLEKVTFTLAPEKVTEGNFYVADISNSSEKDPDYTVCETWNDVLKLINDENADYEIVVEKDVSVDKLTFPTAAKAKSVTISNGGTGTAATITTKSSSVTLPTNVTIANVNINVVDNNGKQAKSFTLSASKDLTVFNLSINADKAVIKGGAKSVLTLFNDCHAEITGFGTVAVPDNEIVNFDKPIKAQNLKLGSGATAYFGTSTATFTNIESGERGYIVYNTTNYTPVSVTGNITGEVMISTENADGRYIKFASGDVILVSKNANLANIRLAASSSSYSHTVGRVGSNIAVMDAVFEMNGKKYAQWSDALSVIAANAKADKAYAAKTSYRVTISDELNMNGAFKMPAAGTFSVLHFMGSSSNVPTIKFTGNITLTNLTIFENIKLDSVKKVNGTDSSVDFSIAAGKNELDLVNVKSGASIKSITSSGELYLCDVAASSITAADVNIVPTQQNGINSYGAIVNGEWEGKDIKNPSVMVAGNLTVKNKLAIGGALTVKGILNVGKIYSNTSDATLVLYKQAKGKNALVIGKNGIENDSEQIKFVLADSETNKTAQITEDLVLGTIAGPYADQFVPSDDNLAETDSYRIIKDSNKLIAVPKEKDQKEYLVKVTVNGKAAYYKSLDEAIKDISATGSNTDEVVITVTQDMFGDSIAKLPLPTAGKYGKLTYTAESAVTINVTSDLTLTGDLVLDENVALNKVDKSGEVVLPISVNVGKYTLTANSALSAKTASADKTTKDGGSVTDTNSVSQITNISGTGKFVTSVDVEVAGKVTGTTLVLDGNMVTLGDKAVFNASIDTTTESTLAYTNAKNVKFVSVTGAGLKIAGTFTAGETVANITGDYTKDAVVIDGELKVVRSGNTLKAVTADEVVEVEAWPLTSYGTYDDENTTTRLYDSVASAASDISRIKESASYQINLKKDDTLVLPKAKTYSRVMFEVSEDVEASKGVTLTTARDITFTGDFNVGENVTIVKANGTPLSINAGTYRFWNDGKVAPDENGVSQYNNIISKDYVYLTNESKINGNLNVSDLWISGDVELGSKATFNASEIYVYNLDNSVSIKYPVKNAKNVKFGKAGGINKLNLSIEDVKEGDQVAVLTGDYYYGTVLINGFEPDEDTDLNSGLVPARSGSKLMAINFENACLTIIDAEHEEDMKHILYVSYADAIADINRLNDKNGVYMVYLPTNTNITRLTLPTKGKYNTLGLLNWTDEVTLKLTSDVVLTGNLGVYSGVILQKNEGTSKDILKFTSPKGKDNKPLYTVAAEDGGIIVNGTLNGEKIDSPEKPVNVTLPYTNKDGFDLSNGSKLKIATADVEEGGVITITTAEEVPDSSIKFLLADNSDSAKSLTHKSGTNTYTYTIVLESKSMIKSSGFSVSGSEGKVTSITYTAPSIVNIKLPYNNADGIDLSANKIRFDMGNAEENGVITITTAEEVPVSSITLSKTSTTLNFNLTHESGTNTYTYTISSTWLDLIQGSSLTVSGSEGKVTSITYTAPTPKTTVTCDIPSGFMGGVDLSESILKCEKKYVAENDVITVTLAENITSNIIFKDINGKVLESKAPDAGVQTVTFTLTAEQASEITSNGFIIEGKEGIIILIEHTSDGNNPWS